MKVEARIETYPQALPDHCLQCLAPIVVTLESEADRQAWVRGGVVCRRCEDRQAGAVRPVEVR